MTNAEIIAWHRAAAKQLRIEGKPGYALEHKDIANYFQSNPQLDDDTLNK